MSNSNNNKFVTDLQLSNSQNPPLTTKLLTIEGQASGPTLVVLAGIHGDEYEGVLAIQDLFETLEPHNHNLKGKILMVPICNPLAFDGYARSSPEDGKNLARAFPGSQTGTVTEQIAFELAKVIRQADFLIDLHSAGTTMTSPTLVGYYRQAGAVGDKAAEAARAFGVPVVWEHSTIAPGRTLSLAADFSIPALYTEANGGMRVREDDLKMFREGILNVLGVLCMLERTSSKSEPLVLGGDGNTDTMLNFKTSGIFRSNVEVLQSIERGDLIGVVKDVDGSILEEVMAPQNGRVVFLRAVPYVKQGDLAVLIAEELSTQ